MLPHSQREHGFRSQIRDEEIKAVSGNRALVESEEASTINCQALGSKRLEKVGADLDVSRVIGNRGTGNHRRIARACNRYLKIYAGQRGTAHPTGAAS